MKKILRSNEAYVEINSYGAYVDKFEISNEPIFFPKVMVKINDKLKLRGGMHVCAPNFGSDKIYSSLDNHGFARDLEWEIVEEADDFIKLSLDGIGQYEKVVFNLIYKISSTSLLARLTIKNESSKYKLIAPAFHPYFYSTKSLSIDGKDLNKEELLDSKILKSSKEVFNTNSKSIEILGKENINEFVIWSDFKGDYVCVEPTYMSTAFLNESRDPYILKPNETFIQEIKIKVNNI